MNFPVIAVFKPSTTDKLALLTLPEKDGNYLDVRADHNEKIIDVKFQSQTKIFLIAPWYDDTSTLDENNVLKFIERTDQLYLRWLLKRSLYEQIISPEYLGEYHWKNTFTSTSKTTDFSAEAENEIAVNKYCKPMKVVSYVETDDKNYKFIDTQTLPVRDESGIIECIVLGFSKKESMYGRLKEYKLDLDDVGG